MTVESKFYAKSYNNVPMDRVNKSVVCKGPSSPLKIITIVQGPWTLSMVYLGWDWLTHSMFWTIPMTPCIIISVCIHHAYEHICSLLRWFTSCSGLLGTLSSHIGGFLSPKGLLSYHHMGLVPMVEFEPLCILRLYGFLMFSAIIIYAISSLSTLFQCVWFE